MKITITENSTGTDINVSDDFYWEYQEDSGIVDVIRKYHSKYDIIVGVVLPLNTKDGYEVKDFYQRRYVQKETLAEAVAWLNLNLTMELNLDRPLENETPFVKDKYALNKPFAIAVKGGLIRILEEPTAEISNFELTTNYEWVLDHVFGDVALAYNYNDGRKKRLAVILPALVEEHFTVLLHTDIEPIDTENGTAVYPTMTEAIQAICKTLITEI